MRQESLYASANARGNVSGIGMGRQARLIASSLVVWILFGGFAHGAGAGKLCSTPELASRVIAGAPSPHSLVGSVAHSVPTDPNNCVRSYCEASAGRPDDVRTAVGTGISYAFSRYIDHDDTANASRILDAACADACDERLRSAFAANQGTSTKRLCDLNSAGNPASILDLGDSGDSGGEQASRN